MTKRISFTVLGSGCSTASPDPMCRLRPEQCCPACKDAFANPLTSRNVRGNTSAAIHVEHEDGTDTDTIVIDCGKTFREGALKYFARAGVKRITLVITHAHIDAFGGLDDTRPWIGGTSGVQGHIDVYCTRLTHDGIKKTFYWLFDDPSKPKSTNHLPKFRWHIMPDDEDWTICGITLSPFQFHHGKHGSLTTLCTAFLIDHSVLYASDVFYIPDSEWVRLHEKLALPTRDGQYGSLRPRLQAAILDATSLFAFYTPHFSVGQAIATTRRLGALRTVFTGIPHGYSHATWEAWCHIFAHHHAAAPSTPGQGPKGMPDLWWDWPEKEERRAVEKNGERGWSEHSFFEHAMESVRLWETEDALSRPAGEPVRLHGIDTRPAYDGMTFNWTSWQHGYHPHDARFDGLEPHRRN